MTNKKFLNHEKNLKISIIYLKKNYKIRLFHKLPVAIYKTTVEKLIILICF